MTNPPCGKRARIHGSFPGGMALRVAKTAVFYVCVDLEIGFVSLVWGASEAAKCAKSASFRPKIVRCFWGVCLNRFYFRIA